MQQVRHPFCIRGGYEKKLDYRGHLCDLSGYGAKVMCSAVFVAGRDPVSVAKEDLGHFPFSLGRFVVDRKDSSVTGTVWGLASVKAICRRGLGATLVNGLTEQQLRRQVPDAWLPLAPALDQDTMDWPQGDRISDTGGAVCSRI